MTDYKNSNNQRFRYIFVIIDNFSKYLWAIPFKNKNIQTITQDFSKILTISKRSPLKIESDIGKEWYNSIIQNFIKNKYVHHYSRYTEKKPSVCDRVIRTVRNLLKKKTVFEKGKADWLKELSSVIKKYKKTFHSSTEMTPIQASKNQMKN